MGIQLVLVASLFVAASNLCFRRGIDAGGTSKGFLMVQLFVIFLIAILLNPVRTGHYEWNSEMAAFGAMTGIVFAGMMVALGKALESGPPGLTIAALNASTVMPMVVMSLLFGATFGFIYTIWHGVGSILVIAGLFWAGAQTVRTGSKMRWASFVIAMFCLHVLLLVLMQWRALFINFPGSTELFLSFDVSQAKNQWFMPMMFLSATVIQLMIYVSSMKRLPKKQELLYGLLGGISNGIGTYFLIKSTEVATAFENAMIFPIFAVTIIVLCNGWGIFLYKERVNWWATALCVAGIIVGTVDFQRLFGA